MCVRKLFAIANDQRPFPRTRMGKRGRYVALRRLIDNDEIEQSSLQPGVFTPSVRTVAEWRGSRRCRGEDRRQRGPRLTLATRWATPSGIHWP